MPKQRNSSCYVIMDTNEDDDLADPPIDHPILGNLQPWQYLSIWIHTHPGNSPHPSSTDESTFTRFFGHCSHSVMFIMAQDLSCFCRLRLSTKRLALSTDLKVFYDTNPLIHTPMAEPWLKAYSEKCSAFHEPAQTYDWNLSPGWSNGLPIGTQSTFEDSKSGTFIFDPPTDKLVPKHDSGRLAAGADWAAHNAKKRATNLLVPPPTSWRLTPDEMRSLQAYTQRLHRLTTEADIELNNDPTSRAAEDAVGDYNKAMSYYNDLGSEEQDFVDRHLEILDNTTNRKPPNKEPPNANT